MSEAHTVNRTHGAELERCVSELLSQNLFDHNEIHRLTLRDLPDCAAKWALLRSRFALGLSNCPNSRVVVGDDGRPLPPDALANLLRIQSPTSRPTRKA